MAEKRNTRPKRSAKPGGKKAQPSMQGHRKNIYRKSRYYRQRQRPHPYLSRDPGCPAGSHRRHFPFTPVLLQQSLLPAQVHRMHQFQISKRSQTAILRILLLRQNQLLRRLLSL